MGELWKQCKYKKLVPEVYKLMVFNMFTNLCNHYHNLVLEHSSAPKETLYLFMVTVFHQSQATTYLNFYLWMCIFCILHKLSILIVLQIVSSLYTHTSKRSSLKLLYKDWFLEFIPWILNHISHQILNRCQETSWIL